jgi:hypothetical protein
MISPSHNAIKRLHGSERRKDLTDAYDRALLRAYPVIRDDVLVEVAAAILNNGPHTYPAQGNWDLRNSYADFVLDLRSGS